MLRKSLIDLAISSDKFLKYLEEQDKSYKSKGSFWKSRNLKPLAEKFSSARLREILELK